MPLIVRSCATPVAGATARLVRIDRVVRVRHRVVARGLRDLGENGTRRRRARRCRREVGLLAARRHVRRVHVAGRVGVLRVRVQVRGAADVPVEVVEPGDLSPANVELLHFEPQKTGQRRWHASQARCATAVEARASRRHREEHGWRSATGRSRRPDPRRRSADPARRSRRPRRRLLQDREARRARRST